MGNYTQSYHTHAKGEEYGWWADAIHPAHLDDNKELLPDTAWHRHVSQARTLEEARFRLNLLCEGLPT